MLSPRFIGYIELVVFAECILYNQHVNLIPENTAVVRPSGWRRKASKERCSLAVLCHSALSPQTYQLWAVCLLFNDGLHDKLTKSSALNAVYPKGYGNDKFKVEYIIADAFVLFYMTAHITFS